MALIITDWGEFQVDVCWAGSTPSWRPCLAVNLLVQARQCTKAAVLFLVQVYTSVQKAISPEARSHYLVIS